MEWLPGFAVLWLSLLPSSGWSRLPLWLVPADSCSYVGAVPPPSRLVFFSGGVCLFLPLPSLGRCMHWSLNGVANWLADRAVVCHCVVGGFGPCPGSVCHVAYVHAWADGPSCWVRLWLFRLRGCASRFLGACGVRGGPGGGRGVSLGWGCPVFHCPCGAGLMSAGFTFLWHLAVCAGGLLRAGGWGLCPVLPVP